MTTATTEMDRAPNMAKTMDDDIPNLKIERMDDGVGVGLILLEQDAGDGTIASLAIHPIHLRYLAERSGLLESADPLAARTIATLTRRLKVLRERIDHIDYWLNTLSDSRHADMSYEQTYATATAAIAAEFCAELDEDALAPDEALPSTPAPATPNPAGEQGTLL
jgi:hypothetical protein